MLGGSPEALMPCTNLLYPAFMDNWRKSYDARAVMLSLVFCEPIVPLSVLLKERA